MGLPWRSVRSDRRFISAGRQADDAARRGFGCDDCAQKPNGHNWTWLRRSTTHGFANDEIRIRRRELVDLPVLRRRGPGRAVPNATDEVNEGALSHEASGR